MLTLTQHFKDRWFEHFGGPPPGAEKIEQICREAIWLQRCRVLYDKDGVPFKNIGMYWIPEKNIVIKVDWLENKVVTVVTPKAAGKRFARREGGGENDRIFSTTFTVRPPGGWRRAGLPAATAAQAGLRGAAETDDPTAKP